MPFICLARTDIPDGTVQVLDLKPNTSQRSLIYDPPGQTKYVNRAQNEAPVFSSDSTAVTVIDEVAGLRAYLMDTVEPGGLLNAEGTVTLATVLAGDTVTIGGVVFTAVNGTPDPAAQEFDMAGDDTADAVTLATAINDAASQTLIETASGVTVTAAAALGVVTITADVVGSAGALLLSSSNGTRLATSGTFLSRATQDWTNLDAAAEALLARVDGGLSLTVTAVNAALVGAGVTGTELTDAGGSASLGSVENLLWVMAGRGYTVPAGTTVSAAVEGVTAPVFHSEVAGSFQYDVTVAGGAVVDYEYRPVRATYDSTAFQLSLAGGHLYHLTQGVTLFPDSDPVPHASQWWQPGEHFAEATSARVVTVYDNDGSVLG